MLIRKKMPLIMVLLVALSLLVMSSLYYFYISNQLINKNKEKMMKVLDIESVYLESFFNTRLLEVDYLARDYRVIEFIDAYRQAPNNQQSDFRMDNNKMNKYLREIVDKRIDLQDVFILSPYGWSLASNNPKALWIDLSDRQYFIEAMEGKTVISNLLRDRVKGENVVCVATPIYKDHEAMPAGVMVNIIDMESASKSILELVDPTVGQAYLIDDTETIIFHVNEKLIGTRAISDDVANRIFTLYQAINHTNWQLVINQDMNIITASANDALYVMLVLGIIVLGSAALIGVKYAKTITEPITELAYVMHETTKGNLGVRVQFEGANELGLLSKDLNIMLDELLGTYEELSEKNEELIAAEEELRDNNTELVKKHETLMAIEEELRVNYEELEENQKRIWDLAFIDQLTGIPNRTAFMKQIEEDLVVAHATLGYVAVMIMDLDNFKRINDTFGHSIGDQILVKVAERLRGLVHKTYRFSGDEFAVIIKYEMDDGSVKAESSRVLSLFDKPFKILGKEINMRVSIGVSIYPEDGTTAEKLVQNADTAMYIAKGYSNSQFVLYKKVMSASIARRFEIEEVLRRAVKDQLLTMSFQPQYDVQSKRIVAFEALMRLTLEDGNMISPGEFIPIAEETGMIIELGEWALRHVCTIITEWLSNGYEFSHISVNVSGVQLKDERFTKFAELLVREMNISPCFIELEITESVLMEWMEEKINAIGQLKSIGFKIALDDFGTGYSSFNYLRTIPLTTLKIDKSFIDHIGSHKKAKGLVKQIIQIAHDIELIVVAEGVEEQEQYDVLSKTTCDLIQGYYFSKPLVREKAELLLADKSN